MKIVKTNYSKGLIELSFSDGSVSPKLLYSLFAETGLKRGSEITEEELQNLIVASERRRAYNSAVYYASAASISKGMLKEKLSKKYSVEAAGYAADLMEEKGYINDADFAMRYAEKLKNAGKSEKEVKNKLYQKHIESYVIEDTLAALSFSDDKNAEKLITEKYLSKLKEENGKEKVTAALLRKGFSFGDINTAIEKVINNE